MPDTHSNSTRNQRHILVVGGNSGIGRAAVGHLLAQGHQVSAFARTPGDLPELGISVTPFDAESATDEALSSAIPDTLDGVLYCPGSITLKPFHRTTDEDFLRDFQINVLGAARILRAALPSLKNGQDPAVVLFSTVAASTGLGFHASISAAKSGVEGLCRSLAAEWAPKIRVNAIAPSLTDTPLAANLLNSPEKRELAAGRHPLSQVGDPNDLAALACTLLSPETRFVTGQVIHADGGLGSVRTF